MTWMTEDLQLFSYTTPQGLDREHDKTPGELAAYRNHLPTLVKLFGMEG